MISDWILERYKERLIVRFDFDPLAWSSMYPQQFRGMLIAHTGHQRKPLAGGFISFEVHGHRLEHFHVFASTEEAEVEKQIREWTEHWDAPWSAEFEHVFRISHTHLSGNADEVAMSSLVAQSHLALTLGLLYQAGRTHRTKAENALVRDVTYRFSQVVAAATAKLYAGI